MTEIRDFTKQRKDISFRVDGDVFHAAPGIPGKVLMDFAVQFSGMSLTTPVDQQLAAFQGVLDLVLLPESLERFSERLRDRANPIEMDQVEEIVTWLMEQYGMRPSEQPSSSPDGLLPQASGTTSTASTPDVVSISAASPQTAS